MFHPHLWAQITEIVLIATALLISANKHGKPKMAGTHNFWDDTLLLAIRILIFAFAGGFCLIFG